MLNNGECRINIEAIHYLERLAVKQFRQGPSHGAEKVDWYFAECIIQPGCKVVCMAHELQSVGGLIDTNLDCEDTIQLGDVVRGMQTSRSLLDCCIDFLRGDYQASRQAVIERSQVFFEITLSLDHGIALFSPQLAVAR